MICLIYHENKKEKLVLSLYCSHFKPNSLSFECNVCWTLLSWVTLWIQDCQDLARTAEKMMVPTKTVTNTEGIQKSVKLANPGESLKARLRGLVYKMGWANLKDF